MCVDRDRRPARGRRGRGAAWRRWRRPPLDGPSRRRCGPAVDAGCPARGAQGPAADGHTAAAAAAADADGPAEHASRRFAAEHAEHAAARGWRHGWHGPSAGAQLPASQRRHHAAAESRPPVPAQRREPASGHAAGFGHRIAARSRHDSSHGPDEPSRHGGPANAWHRHRHDEAVSGSNARPPRIQRGTWVGEPAGWRICHQAGAAPGPDRRSRRRATRWREHAPRPGRQSSGDPHDEAVVSQSQLPGRRRWRGGGQPPGPTRHRRGESPHDAPRSDRR